MGKKGRWLRATLQSAMPLVAGGALASLLIISFCSSHLENKTAEALTAFLADSDKTRWLLSAELPYLSDEEDGVSSEKTPPSESSGKSSADDPTGEEDAPHGSEIPPGAVFYEESVVNPEEMVAMLDALPIAALSIRPASSKGYVEEQGIYIKNETTYAVDIGASLQKKIDLKFSADGPDILIIHTHGSESYASPDKSYYLSTDTDRSTDSSQNVIAVGEELKRVLTSKGLEVVHVTDLFDYPEYNGAYNRALDAIAATLEKYPSIQMVIDVHRDAMVSSDGIKYKTVAETGNEQVAQLMFVCGTDQGGLPHSGWQDNLRLVIRLQKLLNEKQPGLMRPISLRAARFNQHATSASILLEVGTSGNTLEEALEAVRLFGDTAGDFLKDYQ